MPERQLGTPSGVESAATRLAAVSVHPDIRSLVADHISRPVPITTTVLELPGSVSPDGTRRTIAYNGCPFLYRDLAGNVSMGILTREESPDLLNARFVQYTIEDGKQVKGTEVTGGGQAEGHGLEDPYLFTGDDGGTYIIYVQTDFINGDKTQIGDFRSIIARYDVGSATIGEEFARGPNGQKGFRPRPKENGGWVISMRYRSAKQLDDKSEFVTSWIRETDIDELSSSNVQHALDGWENADPAGIPQSTITLRMEGTDWLGLGPDGNIAHAGGHEYQTVAVQEGESAVSVVNEETIRPYIVTKVVNSEGTVLVEAIVTAQKFEEDYSLQTGDSLKPKSELLRFVVYPVQKFYIPTGEILLATADGLPARRRFRVLLAVGVVDGHNGFVMFSDTEDLTEAQLARQFYSDRVLPESVGAIALPRIFGDSRRSRSEGVA